MRFIKRLLIFVLKMNYFYVLKVLGLTKRYRQLKVKAKIQDQFIRILKTFTTGNKKSRMFSILKRKNLNIAWLMLTSL
nr:MAG TPA: hypothetical protein [Caudoviricetes sp.]